MNQRIQPLFDLSGKVAIVTGASKGIGEAIARGLAEFGAKVVVSSRKQEAVDAVAAAFQADGLEAIAVACHVAKADQQAHLIDQTIATYGRLDILVNNAATNPYFGPIENGSADLLDKIMEVNVRAPFELAQRALPYLKQGGGSIVNISSVEGMRPTFGRGFYSASKAALTMMTQNMAKEWGPQGIRANTIAPGLVKTKFSEVLWSNEKILNQFLREVPLQRIAEPEEVAGVAVFLASDAAGYITGSLITVDGGYVM